MGECTVGNSGQSTQGVGKLNWRIDARGKKTRCPPKYISWASASAIKLTTVLLHQPNSPEVVGQVGVGQIRVRHHEITFQSPSGSPGVPYDEVLCRVIVTDTDDRVTADYLFLRSGHGNDSGLRHLFALKALVHREPEDKRVATR